MLTAAPYACRADAADSLWPGPVDSFGPAPNTKLNHYITGYNFLVGTFSLAAMSDRYRAQHIGQTTVNDKVVIGDGWLEPADDELREAREMPSLALQELDNEADRIIPVLDRLIERIRGLESYYRSRGYLADGFARGKREDPLVVADFQSGLAEMARLGALLDAAIDRRDADGLRAAKQAGDLVGFHGALALQKSNALLMLVRGAKDIRDATLLARGDQLIIDIEAALHDEATQIALAKATGNARRSRRDSSYARVAEHLQSLIGEYRALKRSGDWSCFERMRAAYNAAAEESNVAR